MKRIYRPYKPPNALQPHPHPTQRTLAARFPVKGYPTIFFIDANLAVYKYDGGRSQEGISHYVKSGYKTATPLSFLESPFSPMGKAKGGVIRIASLLMVAYGSLRAQGLDPITAGGCLAFGSMVFVVLFALVTSWLIAPTEHAHQA